MIETIENAGRLRTQGIKSNRSIALLVLREVLLGWIDRSPDRPLGVRRLLSAMWLVGFLLFVQRFAGLVLEPISGQLSGVGLALIGLGFLVGEIHSLAVKTPMCLQYGPTDIRRVRYENEPIRYLTVWAFRILLGLIVGGTGLMVAIQ